MKVAIYPGSFDPITLGHLDIINRAASFCDRLIVAVAKNGSKSSLFSVEERLHMIEECFRDNNNVEVLSFDGLLADFCKNRSITIVVRGLRGHLDFDYESSMARVNEHLNPNMQTVFLLAKADYSHLSSSLIKELASFRGDISPLVPASVVLRFNRLFPT